MPAIQRFQKKNCARDYLNVFEYLSMNFESISMHQKNSYNQQLKDNLKVL